MFCRNCGKELDGDPEICPNCGVSPMTSLGDVYKPHFELISLSDEQRRAFGRHEMNLTVSIDAVIGMHFVTLGLFTLFLFGLKHSLLPLIKHDDFRARRAIGFMFIPFFNLYWQFRFWLRLVDRVNFQLRMAGLRPTISRKLMLATVIVGTIPVVNLAALLVMYPICIVHIQRACNELAEASYEPSMFWPAQNRS
ncbi:MAG: zinc ribbon domain-containing protein [Dehalococcoidia bacterium]|nr:zinc ribbon domain-containing protein [Dehalococcoidia bacterium]